MVRGRKKKPTAVNEANGTYSKNPGRRNKLEPAAPKGPIAIPDWVHNDPIAMQCWESTIKLLDAMKILTEADAHPIEGYCSDFAQWFRLRALVAEANVAQSGEYGDKVKVEATQVHKYQDRMSRFWSAYGMTPSSRAGLIAQQSEDTKGSLADWVGLLSSKN